MSKTLYKHFFKVSGEYVKPTTPISKCPICGEYPFVKRLAAYDEQLNQKGVKWIVNCLNYHPETNHLNGMCWVTLDDAVEAWNGTVKNYEGAEM